MKKNRTQLKNLAPLHALGALDGEDLRAFDALLAQDAEVRAETSAFSQVADGLAESLPRKAPPAHLREVILRRAAEAKARHRATQAIQRLVPAATGGLAFLHDAAGAGWLPLRVPGAFVKLLSFDETTNYAVVLGKLEAGARYPGHAHRRAEDIYMLSGDLHVGNHCLRAGDFHHADAGSEHGENWSEAGCVLIAVLSKEDLMAQLSPAG